MLFLAITCARRKQFSFCSKHIICLYCSQQRSKCLPLALTQTVRQR